MSGGLAFFPRSTSLSGQAVSSPETIEMGDAHLHAQVLVQLVLEMGTRHMRGGMTRGLEPLEHRGMYFMDVSVSAILQSGFSVCPEVLEPAVRRGATRVYPCSAGRFRPGMAGLHQSHHLHFGCMALLISHGAFLLSLGGLVGLHCSRNRHPDLDGQSLALPNTLLIYSDC